jgi:4-aminobutyrate aminotransferase-like enzyme
MRGEDVWLFDAAGNRYLDAGNGCIHIGHQNKQIAEAIDRLPRGSKAQAVYLRALTASYEQQLLATFSDSMDRVYFCSTYREANAFALRLALRSTRAVGVILSSDRIAATLQSILGGDPAGTGVLRPAWARAVVLPREAPNSSQTTEARSRRFLEEVRASVCELRNSSLGVAAIFLDPFLMGDATHGPAVQMIEEAIDTVRQAGGLYIADESQGGLARTGQHFWAHQRYRVSPDLVTVGEALANGLPMAAVVAAANIRVPSNLRPARVGSCLEQLTTRAAAEATLQVVQKQGLRESAARVGAYLRFRLEELTSDHSSLREVHGQGLHQRLEVARTAGLTQWLVSEMQRRRVLMARIESSPFEVSIQPPMTFTLEHVDLLMNAVAEVLRSVPPA